MFLIYKYIHMAHWSEPKITQTSQSVEKGWNYAQSLKTQIAQDTAEDLVQNESEIASSVKVAVETIKGQIDKLPSKLKTNLSDWWVALTSSWHLWHQFAWLARIWWFDAFLTALDDAWLWLWKGIVSRLGRWNIHEMLKDWQIKVYFKENQPDFSSGVATVSVS